MGHSLSSVSAKFNNYRCFGEEFVGYETILPINLIVGRNNTGKSSLLQLIEHLTTNLNISAGSPVGKPSQVQLTTELVHDDIARVFQANYSGGPIPGNHFQYGKDWIGTKITWDVQTKTAISLEKPFDNIGPNQFADALAKIKGNPLSTYRFRRINAEREIVPEPDVPNIELKPNGSGLTNAIQHFINKAWLPSDAVEVKLLAELNKIMAPDVIFERISVQLQQSGVWEIFLTEKGKGAIPLSNMGSGVKTILLTLALLHLVPTHENHPLGNYLFAFEELENNLHPSLQRRLLTYLQAITETSGCHFFLTTHSSVAIDIFAHDENAQIIHVVNMNGMTTARRAATYVANKGIIDDLDVRASDVLQANGIIWVEGPSDRIYVNRWIDLWSEGKLSEGIHYQVLFYGGRLLSHLSGDDPDLPSGDGIRILRVNRNAAMLIDSDKSNPKDSINSTKKRLVKEIEALGGLAWVTGGRTIENYLPPRVIKELYPGARVTDPFEKFEVLLNTAKKEAGDRLLQQKVSFAGEVAPLLRKDDFAGLLDLSEKLTALCDQVRRWNRIGTN